MSDYILNKNIIIIIIIDEVVLKLMGDQCRSSLRIEMRFIEVGYKHLANQCEVNLTLLPRADLDLSVFSYDFF